MAETLWWPSIALDFVKRVAARDSAFANDYQLINFFFFLASMVVVVVDLKGTVFTVESFFFYIAIMEFNLNLYH